jgi:hypothetical protein
MKNKMNKQFLCSHEKGGAVLKFINSGLAFLGGPSGGLGTGGQLTIFILTVILPGRGLYMPTVSLEITNMSTVELEEYIDSRYEAGAPQDELDALETQYATRVSEDDLNMTEDEPNMREAHEMGVDLEEWLASEYHQYTHPEDRAGGRDEKGYFRRSSFNDFLTLNLKPGITKKDIMAAAKDVYEYKRDLIQRYRSKNKLFNIPSSLWPRRSRVAAFESSK